MNMAMGVTGRSWTLIVHYNPVIDKGWIQRIFFEPYAWHHIVIPELDKFWEEVEPELKKRGKWYKEVDMKLVENPQDIPEDDRHLSETLQDQPIPYPSYLGKENLELLTSVKALQS